MLLRVLARRSSEGLFAVASSLVGLSCASGPEGADSVPGLDATVPAPPTATGAASAPSAGASSGLAGTWASPSCGGRAYERVVVLREGTFTASDRVSPCPPGAACVWSGVVERAGRYELQGDEVRLVVERGGDAKAGVALPAALKLEGGALVEVEGTTRCVYARR